jgi:hypothetical protein
MVTLVIGQATAERIGQSPRAAVTVAGPRSRRFHPVRGRRPDGHLDAYVESLARSGSSAVVLAGDDEGELRRAARALGRDVLRLPAEHTSAAWVVSVGAALARAERAPLLRVLQVLCNGPAAAPGPHRQWNDGAVPALRPATLARWATRSWAQCGWCRGGGLPGSACCVCGSLICGGGVEVIA